MDEINWALSEEEQNIIKFPSESVRKLRFVKKEIESIGGKPALFFFEECMERYKHDETLINIKR